MSDSDTKYLIDSDVIAAVKNRPDSDAIYFELAQMVAAGRLRTVRQVIGELKPETFPALRKFVDHTANLVVETEAQYSDGVAKKMEILLTALPKLINVTGGSGKDPADPWLVAVASCHGFTVVTNESPWSGIKIPAACKLPGIMCPIFRGPEFLLREKIVQDFNYAHVHPKSFFGD